jgi:hypothetical protein
MLSVSGARKLELALPAGADVDNWYANRVMGQPPWEWRHGGEAAAAGGEVAAGHMGKPRRRLQRCQHWPWVARMAAAFGRS